MSLVASLKELTLNAMTEAGFTILDVKSDFISPKFDVIVKGTEEHGDDWICLAIEGDKLVQHDFSGVFLIADLQDEEQFCQQIKHWHDTCERTFLRPFSKAEPESKEQPVSYYKNAPDWRFIVRDAIHWNPVAIYEGDCADPIAFADNPEQARIFCNAVNKLRSGKQLAKNELEKQLNEVRIEKLVAAVVDAPKPLGEVLVYARHEECGNTSSQIIISVMTGPNPGDQFHVETPATDEYMEKVKVKLKEQGVKLFETFEQYSRACDLHWAS